jgi:hypothetical protein
MAGGGMLRWQYGRSSSLPEAEARQIMQAGRRQQKREP